MTPLLCFVNQFTVVGNFMDFDGAVKTAMTGAYGAFVNTDGFAVGAMAETYAGIRLYETAKAVGVRHYIYSSLFHARKVCRRGTDSRRRS